VGTEEKTMEISPILRKGIWLDESWCSSWAKWWNGE
jgi:hypothetical protein